MTQPVHAPKRRQKIFRFKRLPLTSTTKEKIRQALTGRKQSPETCAKRSAALKGRKLTEEHKEAIRRAKAPKTDEQLIAETLERSKARKKRWQAERQLQWKLDILTALKIGDKALLEDIRESRGDRVKRTKFHPRVSCGFSWDRGEVVWDPTEPYRGRDVRTNYGED